MKQDILFLERIIHDLEDYLFFARKIEILSGEIEQRPSYDIEGYHYVDLIVRGATVCEKMLVYSLIRRGFEIKYGMVIQNSHSYPIFYFCANRGFFPEEIRKYLIIIGKIRNQSVHLSESAITKESARSFFDALFYFSIWFDNDVEAGGRILKVFERFSTSSPANKLSLFSNIIDPLSGVAYSVCPTQEQLLSHRVSLALEYLQKQLDEINERTRLMNQRDERMEQTLHQISEQITNLTNQISSFQSLVQRQIQLSISDEEKEHIIQAFTDECVPRIVENMRANNEEIRFEQEKKKLIASFGKSAWGKMSDASQMFLISSKVMYNNLILLDDAIDYSGVCLLITKALEVELKKRFFHGFLNYLDDTYKKDYSVYPTALLIRKAPKTEDQLSLGTIPFILCYYDSKTDSLSQSKNNRQKLLEYSRNCLFSKLDDEEIDTVLNGYASRVESVRESFRNPAAHSNEINRTTAEECFNLIIDVEKLLKKMLDSFDY